MNNLKRGNHNKNYSPEKKKSKKDNCVNTSKEVEDVNLNDDFVVIQSYLSNTSVAKDKCTSTVQSPATANIDDVNVLLYKNSLEILARLTVIENSLIKTGALTQKSLEVKPKSIDAVNAFMVAHHLPLKSMDHLKNFESNLQNESVRKTSVSIYVNFHLLCVNFEKNYPAYDYSPYYCAY